MTSRFESSRIYTSVHNPARFAMQEKYTHPEFEASAFNCPHCHAYAAQRWEVLSTTNANNTLQTRGHNYHSDFRVTTCSSCTYKTIWFQHKIVFPLTGFGIRPNLDLPEDIRADFEEASQIAKLSPRGAAALLRLCVQKLCKHLGEPGRDINTDIGSLVAKGLPVSVQQALDAVRIIGNNAVHPGEIDLRDDLETVGKLFKMVNIIANKMITEPKEIADLYNGLPAGKLQGVKQRDGT